MAEQRATAYDSKIEGNVIFTRLDAALKQLDLQLAKVLRAPAGIDITFV